MKTRSGRTLSAVPARLKHPTLLRDPVIWIVCILAVVLLCKFLWPLLRFELPLGYDAGIYRYLFLRHAEGFPPFWITDLEPWARAHPLGLFFFSTVFLRLGIPVDWLIGWVWNLFAVVVMCVLSWTAGKRYGREIGVWTLVACVLSVSTFDGFAAMYFKTFASLLWMVLTFRFIERKSLWAIPFGILTVITHNQTGLLFGLVLITYAILPFISWVKPSHPLRLQSVSLRQIGIVLGGGLLIVVIGLLAYLPVWKDAILTQLPALLGETEASSGSFPPALYYLQVEAVVLFFGAIGFLLQIRRERWSLWQLSVVWSFLFVALHLLFYRRFFLQLEFFLLPFAGIGLHAVWNRWRGMRFHIAIAAVLLAQLLVMQRAIAVREPTVDTATFEGILQGRDVVPVNAFILSLEDQSPVILRGWFTEQHVGGPGLFDVPWTFDQWEMFLLGTHDDRVMLLQQLPQPVYLFASPFFRSYYGDYATQFLQDSCFEQIADTMYYRVVCQSEITR